MVEIYTAAEICAHLGIGRRALKTKVEKGEITKLDRGIYAMGALSVQDRIRALQNLHPNWVLTGLNALQFHANQQITFPLRFRTGRPEKSRVAETFIVTAHRTHNVSTSGVFNVATPILAAWEARHDASAGDLRQFLEEKYAGKEGKWRLETDLVWMGKVPEELRKYLQTLSIGADSNLERRFFAALEARGLEFEQNVQIGPFLWDFQSRKLRRLLIEIGAYEYHRDLSAARGQASYIREVWKFNYASLHDYVVLQFTAKCVDTELERCLDMVEDVMTAMRGGAKKEWKAPWKWHSWLLGRR